LEPLPFRGQLGFRPDPDGQRIGDDGARLSSIFSGDGAAAQPRGSGCSAAMLPKAATR